MVRLRDLERSASPSWVGGIFQDCLASRRGCWESASLRKLGKQGFPDLRNLAMCCGLGAWGRRGRLPLTNLEYGSQALPLFGISGAALTVKGKVVGLCPTPCHLLKKGEGRQWRPSRADRGGSRDDENFRLARHQVPGFLLTLQKLPLARRQLPFLPSPPTTFTERSPILCLLKKSPCPPLSSKWTAMR